MSDLHSDILISGGGIAGLTAAAALGRLGLNVLLADPATPGTKDLRSTAFLHPARALFEEIGLWDTLARDTTPLNALRIIDTTGWPPQVTETRVFNASDMNLASFGWNLPNQATRAALLKHIDKYPNIIRISAGFQSMLTRTQEAIVTLTNGQRIRTKLVLGADGRKSATRQAVGIKSETRSYGQKAFAFVATHTFRHDSVSVEIYNQGGAFTTVPLPDHNGRPSSAIVWMNASAKAKSLAALDVKDFDAEMTTRACNVLGSMHRIGPLSLWPVITQRAMRLTGERTALIAEAAHVLPPIGAQGLNTSLHDVAALYNIVRSRAIDPGAPAQLALYEKARYKDIAMRAHVIDAFNRICMSGTPAIQALRRTSLAAVYDIAPIRQTVMKAGLGTR